MGRQCSRTADLRDLDRATSIRSGRGRVAFGLFALAVVAAAASAFYVPALRATHGVWPAPLDDVYIHFDFAKSAATGHPFCWIPGNGYSSGGTSMLYPLVLALGWTVGFRGLLLGWFAAIVAVSSLVDAAWSLADVVEGRPVAIAAPVLLVAVPLLDWTWFSGMEVAFSFALLARALKEGARAARASPHRRARRQLRAGLYLAALAISRPECAAFALPMAVAVAHAAGSLSAVASLARAGLPTVVTLALQAGVNFVETGETRAAGALRKLVTESPYASGPDVATLFLTNLVRLRTEGVELALGGRVGVASCLALAAVGALDRRLGRYSIALLSGALGALALVCLNTTAPFQNMRYVAPTLAMLIAAAFLGVARLTKRFGALGAIPAAVLVALAAPAFSRQIDHFARSSRNIVEQQVEVGRRLAALPTPPRRVFVGDAGAIPYVSGLPALDGLGLGGYRGLPFARASVAGGPAVLELIERMPKDERPDVLAVYDAWWPDLVPRFGQKLFEVTIDDNVICGDRTKSVYRADWSLLEDRRTVDGLDRVDVGDLVDERDHAFEIPGPHAGYVIGVVGRVDDGSLRFDAGRIVPEGGEARFVVRSAASGEVRLQIVDDGAPFDLALRTPQGEREVHVGEGASGVFRTTVVEHLRLSAGDRVSMHVVKGPLRLFALGVASPR